MKTKKVYISVTNDLLTDQRVHKTALMIMESGAEVVVIGRKWPSKEPIKGRLYQVKRFHILINKGFLFYAFYNIRLFLYLLVHHADILVANDLDTLPANYLISRLKGRPLVYDSHEYFTEVPELINRKRVRKIWLVLEKMMLPRIKFSSTVSESVAKEYRVKYDIQMGVIRNLSPLMRKEKRGPDQLHCNPRRVIIYQGALNEGRGLESMILAMRFLDKYQLQIFGTGYLKSKLEELIKRNNLGDYAFLCGRVPFNELKEYTRQASVGISLEENKGLNYYYSLPNKLFDYIHALIPVLVSDLPEMRKIVQEYNIGLIIDSHEPDHIAEKIQIMMEDHELRISWKRNLTEAARDLCWEKEVGKLKDIYRRAGLYI